MNNVVTVPTPVLSILATLNKVEAQIRTLQDDATVLRQDLIKQIIADNNLHLLSVNMAGARRTYR